MCWHQPIIMVLVGQENIGREWVDRGLRGGQNGHYVDITSILCIEYTLFVDTPSKSNHLGALCLTNRTDLIPCFPALYLLMLKSAIF